MKWRTLIGGVSVAAMLSCVTMGQASEALLNKLVEKGILTQREANAIREEMGAEQAATVEAFSKTKVGSWVDALAWSGDARLRGEYFDYEDDPATGKNLADNKGGAQADRLRFRVRLRLALEARFVDWATVGVRLASGSANDPVSTNQSFTDTFGKKPLFIDAAYVTIQPPGWDWLKLTAGKMDIPLWQPKFNSPMVYDFDLTPEGVAEQLQWKFGDKQQHRLFANFGQFAVKEISSDANDVYLFDLQGGIEAKFGSDPKTPKLRLAGAGGYYLTQNLKNLAGGDSPNFGNAFTGSKTNYLADFNVLYARGEAAWLLSERAFCRTPAVITVSGEYDENLVSRFDKLPGSLFGATNSLDQTTGWTVQVAFGEAKKKGQWQIAYQYKYLEADATFDAVTDSDWGNGGTDRKGHVVKAAYNLQDWWQLAFAAFITEKISDRPNTGRNQNGLADENQLRIQADTIFKF